MKPPPDPHYRHRFSAEIISHAGWLITCSASASETLSSFWPNAVSSSLTRPFGAGVRNSARTLPNACAAACQTALKVDPLSASKIGSDSRVDGPAGSRARMRNLTVGSIAIICSASHEGVTRQAISSSPSPSCLSVVAHFMSSKAELSSQQGISLQPHMWNGPRRKGLPNRLNPRGRCVHMYGLEARCMTAGLDEIRETRS
jgi:hypothetical protein